MAQMIMKDNGGLFRVNKELFSQSQKPSWTARLTVRYCTANTHAIIRFSPATQNVDFPGEIVPLEEKQNGNFYT